MFFLNKSLMLNTDVDVLRAKFFLKFTVPEQWFTFSEHSPMPPHTAESSVSVNTWHTFPFRNIQCSTTKMKVIKLMWMFAQALKISTSVKSCHIYLC